MRNSILWSAAFLWLLVNSQSQTIITDPTPKYIDGCYRYGSTTSCAECEFGFQKTPEGLCEFNHKPVHQSKCCLKFNEQGECSECAHGLYVDNGACVRTSIIGCITKNRDTCLKCAQDYVLNSGKCYRGIPNCQQYSPIADSPHQQTVCKKCTQGYTLENGNTCREKIAQGCRLSEAGTCVECFSPFSLADGECKVSNCNQHNDFGCISCNPGYYLNIEGKCSKASQGCLAYQHSQCSQCASSYTLSKNECHMEGCVTYSDPSTCTKCEERYILAKGACVIPNCEYWKDGHCIACNPSFYLSHGKCLPKSFTIKGYVADVCKQCAPNFQFNQSVNRCLQVKPQSNPNMPGKPSIAEQQIQLHSKEPVSKLESTIASASMDADAIQKSRRKISVQKSTTRTIKQGVISKYAEVISSNPENKNSPSDFGIDSKLSWRSASNDPKKLHYVGIKVDSPLIFSRIVLQSGSDSESYLREIEIEYSEDLVAYKKVGRVYEVKALESKKPLTLEFPAVKARAIRILIKSFQNWPSCRFQFLYEVEGNTEASILFEDWVSKLAIRYKKRIQDIKYEFYTAENEQTQSVTVYKGSGFGDFESSSSFDRANFNTLGGWRAAVSKTGEWAGLRMKIPVTFHSLKVSRMTISANQDAYISEFYIEYSIDGKHFSRIQKPFTCSAFQKGDSNATQTFNFGPIKASEIRIVVNKFVVWPAGKFEFYFATDRLEELIALQYSAHNTKSQKRYKTVTKTVVHTSHGDMIGKGLQHTTEQNVDEITHSPRLKLETKLESSRNLVLFYNFPTLRTLKSVTFTGKNGSALSQDLFVEKREFFIMYEPAQPSGNKCSASFTKQHDLVCVDNCKPVPLTKQKYTLPSAIRTQKVQITVLNKSTAKPDIGVEFQFEKP